MDSKDEEKLYEYFTNRPIGFVIFFTLSLIISILGILGNLMLIYTKLRKFSYLSGLDYLIINVAVSVMSLTSIFLLLLTDEMFHEFAEEGFCNTVWFLQGLAQTSIAFSSLTLIISSKYFSRISKRNATILVAITWILAFLDAYPYFGFEVFPLKMKNGQYRNVCHLSIESHEDYYSFLRHQMIMLTIEFGIPTLLLIATSCVAFLWRKPDSSTNKIIFNYSLTIAAYFILINTPLVINRFTATRNIAKMNLNLRHIFRFLLNLTVLLNPIVYGYFDDFFVKEVLRIVTFNDFGGDVVYEHHEDKDIEYA